MTTTTLVRPVTDTTMGGSTKSRRVRTGCLTCRERHLKCDETVPDCLNCRKSNRHCKRGVRLNFLEVNVHKPDYMALSTEWAVQFQDESREIASDYQDGLSRYAPYDRNLKDAFKGKTEQRKWPQAQPSDLPIQRDIVIERQVVPGGYDESKFDEATAISASTILPNLSNELTHHPFVFETRGDQAHSEPDYVIPLYPIDGSSRRNTIQCEVSFPEQLLAVKEEAARQARRTSDASSATSMVPLATLLPPSPADGDNDDESSDSSHLLSSERRPKNGEREFLSSPEELYYMQIFVEKVGTWMDSFDKEKHFSRLIPYHALKSTMLLNAFLACGAKHSSLFAPEKEDKALFYYNTATTQLLRSLQNPDRNMAECATTAVILNVYEIMSEKPAQRMSHIAGARALIRECGWDAKSTGIGAACFWLNIGMEVLSCLSMDWITTWNPEHWGLNMEFPDLEDDAGVGYEEIWVHRIFYIVAKTVNFRATAPEILKATTPFEHIRLSTRITQWQELKRLCDRWNNTCPRTMHPLGYLRASKVGEKSAFPQVWMIKTAAIVGRLFYHTSQCILAQTHPLESDKTSQEMREMQLHHAHQVCGIIAHTKDRGIDSIAIRCLPVVGAILMEPREQQEVLTILQRISSHSGWRLGMVEMELKRAWGWGRTKLPVPLFKNPSTNGQNAAEHPSNGMSFQASAITARPTTPMTPFTTRISTPPVVAPVPMKAPVNPLSFADFSLPNHPYQNWYEPPNQVGEFHPRLF